MATRRNALLAILAGSATAALADPALQQTSEHSEHQDPSQDQSKVADRKPTNLSEEEYRTLTRVTDLILPRTDTPGASETGVPWRIDQAVGRKPELPELYRNGLAALNTAAQTEGSSDFVSLPEAKQIQILTLFCDQTGTPEHEFFTSVKGLTIEWYYNTEAGLAGELGFKGNTFRKEFPGCTHPEHWPLQTS